MKTSVAPTSRSFLLRLAVASGIVLFYVLMARAGGPRKVAGTVDFDTTVAGRPLSWAQGSAVYYTDRGDISPALPNLSANNFVAAAFSQWAAVQTAALQTTSGGQLAEDINGGNVTLNSDGTISVPPDIQSNATGTPIGIVYDNDGSVTDALLGAGASSQCFYNAAFGGTDNYGSLATYQHGLIVINGLCAQQSSQFPDVQYRLLRVIGSILGVGWSQANVNVLTGSPHATSDDFAGFPVMHFIDPLNCVPITRCYPNPAQLSLDDIAAIARLYPVTAQNQSSFPGKQVLAAATARIRGSVWFTDAHGNRTQQMQGVNVVARWIDPTTGQSSRRYVATSVSGFLFCGNDGNPITGSDDALGDPLEAWGSDDETFRGFFDLAGLPLPNGGNAQYQLSVEALDPLWSAGVGPYSPGPVSPSGSFQPITVTVSAGSDIQQDILMRGSALPLSHPASSWTTPATLPKGGDWISTLDNYDEADYFSMPAQANRTLSVAVTALDESSRATQVKVQPVIGMWAASDPQGTSPPAFTPSPFNATSFAMTRLDAQVLTDGKFLIGISDIRGDGRPDFRYHAHVLYADTVAPSRIGASGGVVTVRGTGFAPGLTAMIGNRAATQLALSSNQMILAAPASSDGPQSITISDPVSGASTMMTNALQYGAAADDNLVLLSGVALSSPVGAQAPSPMTVRVFAADAVTPVGGATIGWSATNAVQLSACGGSSSCSVVTDENGYAATWVTPAVPGSATITATLAPGAYAPPKSVSVSLTATQSSSDIGALTPYLWISQGATVTVPLTARALSNGTPLGNAQVNFAIESGAGALSASSAQTNSNGYASVTLTVTQIAAHVRVSACIAPAVTRCTIYYANTVPIAHQYLQAVAGADQISNGQPLQAVVVRVTDGSTPPNPVIAAPVAFRTTVLRPGGTVPTGSDGETNSGNPAMPVVLKSADSSAVSDVNGIASIAPSSGGFSPPLEIDIRASGGITVLDFPLELLLPLGSNVAETQSSGVNRLRHPSQGVLPQLEKTFLQRMESRRRDP